MKHLGRSEYESAKRLFVEEVTKLALNDLQRTASATSTSLNKACDDYEEDPFLVGSTYDSPQRVEDETEDTNTRANEECITAVKRDIENYLDPCINVPPTTDPLQWWKENRFRYPKVAIGARKWLCVPGTSTPSERVFSHCGIALSAKRSSMRGDALMNQILLKNNLQHVLCTIEHVKKP